MAALQAALADVKAEISRVGVGAEQRDARSRAVLEKRAEIASERRQEADINQPDKTLRVQVPPPPR